MKKMQMLLVLGVSILSFEASSKECLGLKKCTLDYAVLANKEVEFEKNINADIVSLAVENTSLEKSNFEKNYSEFLAQNLMTANHYKDGKVRVSHLRTGEYIYAPIFLVTKGDIPPMFSKEGPVTLVYKPSKKFSEIRGWGLNRKLSKDNLIEIESHNLIAIFGTYEKASELMQSIFSEDK